MCMNYYKISSDHPIPGKIKPLSRVGLEPKPATTRKQEKRLNRKGVIYALLEPDTAAIRYVGQSIMTAEKRLTFHINATKYSPGSNPKKVAWIKGILESGKSIQYIILENVDYDLDGRERYWVRKKRDEGCDLLNIALMKDPKPPKVREFWAPKPATVFMPKREPTPRVYAKPAPKIAPAKVQVEKAPAEPKISKAEQVRLRRIARWGDNVPVMSKMVLPPKGERKAPAPKQPQARLPRQPNKEQMAYDQIKAEIRRHCRVSKYADSEFEAVLLKLHKKSDCGSKIRHLMGGSHVRVFAHNIEAMIRTLKVAGIVKIKEGSMRDIGNAVFVYHKFKGEGE